MSSPSNDKTSPHASLSFHLVLVSLVYTLTGYSHRLRPSGPTTLVKYAGLKKTWTTAEFVRFNCGLPLSWFLCHIEIMWVDSFKAVENRLRGECTALWGGGLSVKKLRNGRKEWNTSSLNYILHLSSSSEKAFQTIFNKHSMGKPVSDHWGISCANFPPNCLPIL